VIHYPPLRTGSSVSFVTVRARLSHEFKESSDDNRRQSFTGLHNLAMSLAQNGGSLKPGKEEREQRSVTSAAKTMICGTMRKLTPLEIRRPAGPYLNDAQCPFVQD